AGRRAAERRAWSLKYGGRRSGRTVDVGDPGAGLRCGLTPPTRSHYKGAMTAEDVAAQLARERALKQAEKMETIGRLTGAIAQQVNELLGAILARNAALARSPPANRAPDAPELPAH